MRGAETLFRGNHGFEEQNAQKHSPTGGPRGPEQQAMQGFQQNYGVQRNYSISSTKSYVLIDSINKST